MIKTKHLRKTIKIDIDNYIDIIITIMAFKNYLILFMEMFAVSLAVEITDKNTRMKLSRCVSCPNITYYLNNNKEDNNIKNDLKQNNNYYKNTYYPTTNCDYKFIINNKENRIQYLKYRERYNFK